MKTELDGNSPVGAAFPEAENPASGTVPGESVSPETHAAAELSAEEAEHARLHALGLAHDHTHSGEDGHCHNHTHTHENTRAVLNRLSRAIGHLQSVRRMVEDGRDCSEVLIQIAAVRSAIDNTGKIILQDHLKHCILDAAQEGDQKAIDDLCQAIDKYMK